jgi:hypothetical protein
MMTMTMRMTMMAVEMMQEEKAAVKILEITRRNRC